MIVSMTGFGDATAEQSGTHYAVEIRSLNNRFFKPIIKLPDNVSRAGAGDRDDFARKTGARIDHVYFEDAARTAAEAAYHINTHALQAYIEQLRQVKGLDRHRDGSIWRA